MCSTALHLFTVLLIADSGPSLLAKQAAENASMWLCDYSLEHDTL